MVIKDILPGDDESLPYEIREMLSEVMIPISFALKNGEEAVGALSEISSNLSSRE